MITRSMSRAIQQQQQEQEVRRSRARIPQGISAMIRARKAEQALQEKEREAAVIARHKQKEEAEKEKQARKEAKAEAAKKKAQEKEAAASARKARKEQKETYIAERKAYRAAQAAEKRAQKKAQREYEAGEAFNTFWNCAIDAKLRSREEFERMQYAAQALIELSGVRI